MSTSTTLPFLSAFTERRRDAFGLPRGPQLLLPSPDGHDGGGAGGGTGGDGSGTDGAAGGAGGAGTGTPGGQGGTDLGFPENTPWRDMQPDEQIAYWQHQARKHEQRATQRGDYDQLKAKADKFDQLEREKLTPSEQALAEARDAAKAEGRAEAAREANSSAVKAMLEVTLQARGKNTEQVESLLRHTNFETFVTDGAPDTAAIIAHADSIAGPVTGGGNGRGPDLGQGNRGQHSRASGVSAGAEMFAASRGKTS